MFNTLVINYYFRSGDQDFGNYSCVASNLMGSSRYKGPTRLSPHLLCVLQVFPGTQWKTVQHQFLHFSV